MLSFLAIIVTIVTFNMEEKLILNTLTIEEPTEPVKFFFSAEDEAQHNSSIIQSGEYPY